MILHIYKITNLINKKIYIGRTIAKNPIRRWYEHKRNFLKYKNVILYKSMSKYGINNFKFEVIKTINVDSPKEIPSIESSFIKQNNSMIPNGYNMEFLSSYYLRDETTRKSISKKHQGKSKNKNKSSNFIGVSLAKNKRYNCEITKDRKRFFKSFNSEKKAAIAYDKMAYYLFGEDALLNFPYRKNKYLISKIKDFFNFFINKKSIEEKYINYCRGKFIARHKTNRHYIYIGSFNTKKEAMQAKKTFLKNYEN